MKYEESNNIIVYLSDLGFNMQDALLIYNFYKSNTITMIEHNIYGIIDDISGISFLKVDEIGRRQGINLLDAKRIKACIMYIFNNLIFKTGDTYLYYDELKRELFKYLKEELEDEKFKLYIDELRYENKIILNDDKYYLFDIFKAEEKIINKINYLLNKDKKIYKKFDKELKKLEEENNIQYDSNQREAIRKALENKKKSIPLQDLKEGLVKIVEYLCHPEPEKRGHPKNVLATNRTPNYDLERTIAELDLFQRKAELSLYKK